MKQLAQQVGMGVSVMPETILFIGGEVINHLAVQSDMDDETAATLGYNFMVFLKENLIILTKEISDLYAQSIRTLDLVKAHDLAFEFLADKAVEVLNLRPKKSQWETIKEQMSSESMNAIIKAIETANDDELELLFVIYPTLVQAFQNR